MKAKFTIYFNEINHVEMNKKLLSEHPEILKSMDVFLDELINNLKKYCKKNKMIVEIKKELQNE